MKGSSSLLSQLRNRVITASYSTVMFVWSTAALQLLLCQGLALAISLGHLPGKAQKAPIPCPF